MRKIIVLLLLVLLCCFCFAEANFCVKFNLGSFLPYVVDFQQESYILKIPLVFQFVTNDYLTFDFSIEGLLYPVYLVNGGGSIGITWFMFGNAPKGLYIQNHIGTSFGLISMYSSSDYCFYDECSLGYQYLLGKNGNFILTFGLGAVYYLFEQFSIFSIFTDLSLGYKF